MGRPCDDWLTVMFKTLLALVGFRVRPRLCVCDNCLQMMTVNGYGLCEECLDAFDEPGDRLIERWIEARSIDNGEDDSRSYHPV